MKYDDFVTKKEALKILAKALNLKKQTGNDFQDTLDKIAELAAELAKYGAKHHWVAMRNKEVTR